MANLSYMTAAIFGASGGIGKAIVTIRWMGNENSIFSKRRVNVKLKTIRKNLLKIFRESDLRNRPTNFIANNIAENIVMKMSYN